MSSPANHFETLERLLSLEREAERAQLAEAREGLSLVELEAKGHVVLDLEQVDSHYGLGGRVLITLERHDRRPWKAPLAVGDLVELRPRKAEVETPARAVVSRAFRAKVELAFDRPPPAFVAEGRLRLDRVANDVTYERARAVLGRWKAIDRGAARRRQEVLLGLAPPRMERPPERLTFSRPLNPEQEAAVRAALGAEDFFLVHGPPGTGKSTVLAELAVQAMRRGDRLLCTAASNAAVDHLLELCLDAGLRAVRVGHPARVLPHLRDATLDEQVEAHPDRKLSVELFDEAFSLLGYARRQRTQGRSRERFANARASSAEAYRMLDDARALERKAVRAVLDGAQVVCATLSVLETGPLAQEAFTLALLDEATQAIEPLALGAFLKAERVVLAGDPQQLPPTVRSVEAAKRGLDKSLFERLLALHGDAYRQLLREQYRMHADIMGFPSREMYAGELRAHPSVASRTLAEVLTPTAQVDAPPLLFLDTAGKGFDERRGEGESKVNEGEAALVRARVRELLAAGLEPRALAVVTPYRAQAELLREQLADLPELEVDSVDAFQGREKDAIVLSLVRSNGEGALGFLEDLRRMNVALTRAKRHLFIVGDSATLGGHTFYARLLEQVQAQGGYRSAWEWPEPQD